MTAGTAQQIEVIAIDGPSGAGKGTLSKSLAEHLGWHRLESGALYRAVAMLSLWHNTEADAVEKLAELARELRLEFVATKVLLNGKDIGAELRRPEVEERASLISSLPLVRKALLSTQRNCLQPPGLVAEGRDMGTVVFPQARLKIFLTAAAEERARRRRDQLKEKGNHAKMADLLLQNERRDRRDCSRRVSPLAPASDAALIDTTGIPFATVFDKVLKLWQLCNE